MSDERFDQDLRSVLLEDAPRDVPDDLRRRVAAVTMTDPATARPSRPWWGLPVLVRTGALAALAIVLAVAFLRLVPESQPGVGGDPSRSPSVAPSPTSSPPPSITACQAADITAVILGWQGAAGSRIADVEITNGSTYPCFIQGTPGLQLIDARGRVLIDSATAGPSGQPHIGPTDPTFEVASGGRLRTEVQASNYCGAEPATPIDIAFTLPPEGDRFVAKPGPGVASDLAVPPCLGSTGSNIAMNGWRK
jgi:uncharacterized protein DUF4232